MGIVLVNEQQKKTNDGRTTGLSREMKNAHLLETNKKQNKNERYKSIDQIWKTTVFYWTNYFFKRFWQNDSFFKQTSWITFDFLLNKCFFLTNIKNYRFFTEWANLLNERFHRTIIHWENERNRWKLWAIFLRTNLTIFFEQ